MLAYVTIEPSEGYRNRRKAYRTRVLVSFSDKFAAGSVYRAMDGSTLKECREFCALHGLETRLPALSQIEACTRDKCPKFFSRGARRTLDRSPGGHALKVQRGPDGSIQVTNGRSTWAWTGDDLKYIL